MAVHKTLLVERLVLHLIKSRTKPQFPLAITSHVWNTHAIHSSHVPLISIFFYLPVLSKKLSELVGLSINLWAFVVITTICILTLMCDCLSYQN